MAGRMHSQERRATNSPPPIAGEHHYGVGSGNRKAMPSNAGIPSTAPLTIPITHVAAGLTASNSNAVNKKLGIGEYKYDPSFLRSADYYHHFIKVALELEWVSPESVLAAVQGSLPGSDKQVSAFNDLVDQCSERLASVAEMARARVGEAVGADFDEYDDYGWEINLFPQLEDLHDEYDCEEELEQPKACFVADGIGVAAAVCDVSSLSEKNKFHVYQLIHFCCGLGWHASSLELLREDFMHWAAVGEISEHVGFGGMDYKSMSDPEQVKQLLQKIYPEDYDPEDTDTFSVDGIASFYSSAAFAEDACKKLLKPSKRNVSRFLTKIKKDNDTPPWIVKAAEALCSIFDWKVDANEFISGTGHSLFEFNRPVGFGIEGEYRVFESLHETSVMGNEPCFLTIEFNAQIESVISNLTVAESLILYVERQLQELA